MKISVVVCTYRGVPWIAPQLVSVTGQTRPADQIVVRDDCSGDETLAKACDALQSVEGRTRYVGNAATVGGTENFAAAIGDAIGDVIVLADQDDIWESKKLALIEQKFKTHPSAGFAFSDATLVDEQETPLGETLWQRLGVTRSERAAMRSGRIIDPLLRRNLVTGATMAFRAEYRELVLPIPKTWVHDAWIALLISAVAPCVAIEEPLILYRQHRDQQIGERKRNLYGQYLVARKMRREDFRQTAENFGLAAERLRSQTKYPVKREVFQKLDAKIEHWRRRVGMRDRRIRLPAILGEFCRGNYGRYSLGWKSLAQDLFLP